MSGIIFTVIAAIVAIGVLVTVHEYGHYIVARKLGIKVLRFSVGFGKPLWTRVAGADQTEYVVSRIPLGGYVKMLDEREGPVAPEDQGRAFNHKPVWARAAVLVAGPLFNFIFAVAAFWCVFFVGVPEARPVIGSVTAGSDADLAGFRSLDEITAVAGRDVQTWGEANIALLEAVISDDTIDIQVQSDRRARRDLTLAVSGDSAALTEPGALLAGLGLRPWRPPLPARIARVEPGSPAAIAGIVAGDEIRALNQVRIDSWQELVTELSARPGETIQLELERGLRPKSVEVALGEVTVQGERRGRLGVEVAMQNSAELWGDYLTNKRLGVVPAFGKAVTETIGKSVLMLKMFWKMIVGEVSLKNISGPINIAQYAGYTASDGPLYYLQFLALLSLSLGILNLLPIPMLDGGQLVYQVAEAIKGSPVSMRTEIIGQQIGILLLLGLMGIAFYNDIERLIAS